MKMKNMFFIVVLISHLITGYQNLLSAGIKIISISQDKDVILKYSPIFVTIKISADYENPYNPEDIRLDMQIKNSKFDILIPGFFLKKNKDISIWQFRFTPRYIGKYSYYIIVKNKNGNKRSDKKFFNVKESKLNGFLRVEKNSYYYLRFDFGKLFRGLGENFGWESQPHEIPITYTSVFKKLNRYGYNFVRTWMCPWNLPLEWKKYGLNHYDNTVADKLDKIVKLSEQKGIYLMLTLDYHGVLQDKKDQWGANDEWKNNPYNVKNGGPCNTPIDMFKNPIAKKIYKRRLRYIIARWGYSPNIAVFEFWNEIQHVIKDSRIIYNWHKEMAAYLKSIDVNKHLISTSSDDLGDVWYVDDIDFTQSHLYGLTKIFNDTIDYYENKYKKPHVIGEFGYSANLPKANEKKLFEIELHNGLWSGLFSPIPILPLTWWWDYHKKWKDDTIFRSIVNFNNEIMKGKKIYKFNDFLISSKDTNKPKRILYVLGSKPWGKNSNTLFTIDKYGNVKHSNLVPQYLYSGKKISQKNPPVFEVTYKKDGEFYVYVGKVSGQNILAIYVDNKNVLEKYLELKKGEGEWVKSEYKSQWGIFQGVYNKYYGVKIKKGRHKIKVENINKKGADWINIVKYAFVDAGIKGVPPISVNGIRTEKSIFVWIKNNFYSADFVEKNNNVPKGISNVKIIFPKLISGNYVIKYYDTYKGNFFKSVNTKVVNGDKLSIPLYNLKKDFAIQIKK